MGAGGRLEMQNTARRHFIARFLPMYLEFELFA